MLVLLFPLQSLFVDKKRSRLDRVEFVSRHSLPRETCPDCGGSGKYVGLNAVEDCETCGGMGYQL